MHLDFLFQVFRQQPDAEAMVWRDQTFRYDWLLARVEEWRDRLAHYPVPAGTVVALEADFSPNAVAAFLALVEAGSIVVPLSAAVQAKRDDFLRVAEVEIRIAIDSDDQSSITRTAHFATHPLYGELRSRAHPGLVLFSSGSTGESKAALHDLVGILKKFHTRRHARRAIAFLMFDHIGGINTMLYSLSNAGCMVTVRDRTADGVLGAVAHHRVELLPTSPTFLNLILLSEAYRRHDLSSLRLVTYGTEPMPETTLRRFHELFPQIDLLQTYGLSEIGILRSKSQSSDSLWVKIGGEGVQTRIVDGLLEIKTESAMLGYLNSPSPFTPDGWFITGDAVEQEGEYLRILGRKSEIINVGGEKVYPAEVESVIQALENVTDVVVYRERNPILGNIVCAQVAVSQPEEPAALAHRVKLACRAKLQPYKVPVKVTLVDCVEHNPRFKKCRPHE